jgi:hypothetical protein
MNIRLLLFLLAVLLWQCQSKKVQPAVETVDVTDMVRMTHKEATDTLRVDTTQPMAPVNLNKLDAVNAKMALAGIDLGQAVLADWPDNGFYGADRRRIEFIFTGITRDPNNPAVYVVKGKNRYKTTISNFEGRMQIREIMEFTDPNLDTTEIYDMEFRKMYALVGDFRFHEDSSLVTSGFFAGSFKMDIGVLDDGGTQLWFFSESTPAMGCGYRFDGAWTSYKKADLTKPVIWSRDLFRFANDILEEFSYGERDVQINEKYRHLGWDNFWDGEEWWNDSPKKEIQ